MFPDLNSLTNFNEKRPPKVREEFLKKRKNANSFLILTCHESIRIVVLGFASLARVGTKGISTLAYQLVSLLRIESRIAYLKQVSGFSGFLCVNDHLCSS